MQLPVSDMLKTFFIRRAASTATLSSLDTCQSDDNVHWNSRKIRSDSLWATGMMPLEVVFQFNFICRILWCNCKFDSNSSFVLRIATLGDDSRKSCQPINVFKSFLVVPVETDISTKTDFIGIFQQFHKFNFDAFKLVAVDFEDFYGVCERQHVCFEAPNLVIWQDETLQEKQFVKKFCGKKLNKIWR